MNVQATLDFARLYPLDEFKYDHEAPPNSGIRPTRVAGREDVASLRESIRALGQIVPIVFQTHHAVKYVVSGNRRLRAIRELGHSHVMAIDAERLCGTPIEVALADNIIRSPLHPVDKHDAFAALIQAGETVAEIAAAYSIKPREVEQALAVSKLAPEVREVWRAGGIDAETAQTFTMDTDQKRQAAVLKRLGKNNSEGRIQEYQVRRELVGERGDGQRLIRFVGTGAYEAAGGKVMVDLFKDRHGFSDLALLKRCADEKLAAQCRRLVDEDGWLFAVWGEEADRSYMWGRNRREVKLTGDEKARVAAITKQVDAIDEQELQTEDDMDKRDEFAAEAEAIEAAAAMRRWPRKDRAGFGCVVSIDHDGNMEVAPGYTKPAPKVAAKDATPAQKKKAQADRAKAAEGGEVSKALDQRLRVQMLKATQRALRMASEKWDRQNHTLPAILCRVAADRIKPDNSWDAGLEGKQLDAIREAMDSDVMNICCAKEFDAKDYFASVSRANIVAVVREAVSDVEAVHVEKKKVADAVKYALANIPKTGWLPVQLRTPHYAGPGSGKQLRKGRRK